MCETKTRNELTYVLPSLVTVFSPDENPTSMLEAAAAALRVDHVSAEDAHIALLSLVSDDVVDEDDVWVHLRGLTNLAIEQAGGKLRRIDYGTDSHGYSNWTPSVDVKMTSAGWRAFQELDDDMFSTVWDRVSETWWNWLSYLVADMFDGRFQVYSEGRSGGHAVLRLPGDRGEHVGFDQLCGTEGALSQALTVLRVISDHLDVLPALIEDEAVCALSELDDDEAA